MRLFRERGKTKHGRFEQHVTRHAALTADAADAIVPQKEEADLGRLELQSPRSSFAMRLLDRP